MDLTQLANLGEFVGGVAVLVTLVYLAIQLRLGRRLAQIDAHREINTLLSNFLGDIAKDPELHDLWYNGRQARRNLNEEENDRLAQVDPYWRPVAR